MTRQLVVRFPTATARQAEAFRYASDPDVRELLLDGAIRSGKTQAACQALTLDAIEHGGLYVVGRKTYRELEDTTKAVLLKGDGGLPPTIPSELMIGDPRVVDNEVKIRSREGEALIKFRSMEDPETAQEKVRNMTLNGFLIDQAEELKEPGFERFAQTMRSRLSDPRGPRRGYYISNPASETHWLYERFVDESLRRDNTAYVHFTLHDNVENLPPDLVAFLLSTETTDPDFYKRFVLGEWGAFEGKRFRVWNPALHICPPFDIPTDWEVTEGIDYGWTNPTCVIWHAIGYCGHEFLVAEHYEAEKHVSHHARRIREIREDYLLAPSMIWLDPSSWAGRDQYESIAFEFQEYGIHVGKAQNERIGGWNRIDELLRQEIYDERSNGDRVCSCPAGPGRKLRVFEGRCPNLVRELPALVRKEGTDDVEKVNDHAPDATRYIVMSRPFAPVVEEPESDRHTRYLRQLRERAEEHDAMDLYVGG